MTLFILYLSHYWLWGKAFIARTAVKWFEMHPSMNNSQLETHPILAEKVVFFFKYVCSGACWVLEGTLKWYSERYEHFWICMNEFYYNMVRLHINVSEIQLNYCECIFKFNLCQFERQTKQPKPSSTMFGCFRLPISCGSSLIPWRFLIRSFDRIQSHQLTST